MTCSCTPSTYSRDDVDQGYSWIVLIACTVISLFSYGQIFTFNVHYVVFLHTFGESRGYTALVGSTLMGSASLSGLAAALLIKRFGFRTTVLIGATLASVGCTISFAANSIIVLIIFYGLIFGSGVGITYVGCLGAISQYFKKYLSIATGMTLAGSSAGMFLLTPLIEWLHTQYGWRGTLLIQAGFAMQVLFLGAILFPATPSTVMRLQRQLSNDASSQAAPDTRRLSAASMDDGHSSSSGDEGKGFLNPNQKAIVENGISSIEKICTKEANVNPEVKVVTQPPPWYSGLCSQLCDSRFWCLELHSLVFGLGPSFIYIILKDLARIRDLQDYFVLAQTMVGIGNLIGKLLSGILSTWIPPSALNVVYCLCMTLATVAHVLEIPARAKPAAVFVLSSGTIGLCIGATLAANCVLCAQMFGREQMSIMSGFMTFAVGLGRLVCAPALGLIYDDTGSYTQGLVLAAACPIISILCLLTLQLFHMRSRSAHSSPKLSPTPEPVEAPQIIESKA